MRHALRHLLIAATVAATAFPARALEVFACEPEWGALVTALAGDRANVTLALTAFQDPHRLQAKPSLIAAARRADLLVCTGAELEAGWLPLLVRRSANPAIRPGTPGHFLAADHVRRIEVPAVIDRAGGDIHPQGNPHVHLNPHNVARAARALGARLTEVDPAHAADHAARTEAFLSRWERAVAGWETRGADLAGLRLVPNHRSFSYLADWLGLDVPATVEPKPGIPPSGAHLSRLLEQLTPAPPAAVVRTPYGNEKPTAWLAERLRVPEVVLPYTVGGAAGADDLFGLYETTLDALEALRARDGPAP